VPAADPELIRGLALLKENRCGEAEKLLLAVAQRHERNTELVTHVGTRLYEHGRKEALRQLMKGLDGDRHRDARCYNLLGVALLDEKPEEAMAAFKKALRCNLRHGPAYLNLALAYERMNDRESARQCLSRCIALLRFLPAADDARQRLAELEGGGNALPRP
jgi:tetratricopeptide (TPR) repeat protein